MELTTKQLKQLDDLHEKAWQRYRLQWMLDHGFTLDDLTKELEDMLDVNLPEAFGDWEHNCGFGSQIWACKDKFLDCEFKESPGVYLEPKDMAKYRGLTDMKDIPKVLYHVTTKENAELILKTGCIQPMHGKNSERNGEEGYAVYLCRPEQAWFWTVMLGTNGMCIEVHTDEDGFPDDLIYKQNTDGYDEYITGMCITGDAIVRKPVFADVPPLKDRQRFARMVVTTTCTLCTTIARMFRNTMDNDNKHRTDIKAWEELARASEYNAFLIENTDFSCVNIADTLKDYADDGEYAFTDTYMCTDLRLWEMLPKYKNYGYTGNKDTLYGALARLHKAILQNFSSGLYTHTGGFTG